MQYIANVGNNRELYRKAYLLQFFGDDSLTPDYVFTFALPPESEELTYTQRKTETKTFGGLHVDEYGIDAVKIVLSGSTVNQELKRVFGGGNVADKWLTGEEEIYFLRDLLQKYRSLENLQKPGRGKILMYDLSKLGKNSTGNLVKNYWQVFPGDFKIRRSSDRPFTYKYSFEFTGVPIGEAAKEFTSHGKPPELTPAKLGTMQDIMNKLLVLLGYIDGIRGRIQNVLNYANQVSSLLKVFGNVMTYAANAAAGIIDDVGNTAAGLVDGVTGIVQGGNSLISLPRTVQLKALNVGLEVQNAAKGLVQATAALTKNLRGTLFDPDGSYWNTPQEVLDQFNMNDAEFKDALAILFDQAENIAAEQAAAAKSSDIPEAVAGNPDPETGEQRIILIYGYILVVLKATDTLESLAKQYFGDPDKAIDIATLNGILSLSDQPGGGTASPGDTIKIPILTRNPTSRNQIYAQWGTRDNYGRDISLDAEGTIRASGGDYTLTGGADNLAQAVLLRLRESVAKRIRLTAYGIRTAVSDPAVSIAFITSSIELTVGSDPRVSSVDDIRFKGIGDYLNVNVVYSDINNAGGSAAGNV